MLKVLQSAYTQYGIKGFRSALCMIIHEHALFYGFGDYIMRKYSKNK